MQTAADYGWGLSAHEQRLVALGGSFIAVDADKVNLSDLLNSGTPGAIVRCDGPPDSVIRIVVADSPFGVVAGWISEDE